MNSDSIGVLFTDSENRMKPFSVRIKTLGFEPFWMPLIACQMDVYDESMNPLITQLEKCDDVLVLSPRVKPFVDNYIKTSPKGRIYAIGETTASALRECGWSVDAVAQPSSSEGLMQLLSETDFQGRSVVILCGHEPRMLLHDHLIRQGAKVDLLFVYRRQPLQLDWLVIKRKNIRIIVLNSLSAYQALIDQIKDDDWLFCSRLTVLVNSQRLEQIILTDHYFRAVHCMNGSDPHTIWNALNSICDDR